MKTARLIVTEKCVRECPYCVNRQNNGSMVKKARPIPWAELYKLKEYDAVVLTGGEPLLETQRVLDILNFLRTEKPSMKLFLHATTNVAPNLWHTILKFLDGVTWTMHSVGDGWDEDETIDDFEFFQDTIAAYWFNKTLRLKISRDIKRYIKLRANLWDSIEAVKFVDNCPLPANETLFIFKDKIS